MKSKTDPTPVLDARLATTLSSIRKLFGEGSVLRLGANDFPPVEALSTGLLAADIALGIGGLPKGRIVEMFGPESSGKTTVCLSVIAETQRQKGVAAIIDVEHALDLKWARLCGVDTGSLLISQPDSGEEALTIAEQFIRSEAVDLIIIDSVAALVPRSELDGQMGDPTVGAQARLMSQAMRRLTAAIARTKCVCLFTNQVREKIGVIYGSPEYQPGGRALKFFSTIRIDLRRKDILKSPEGVAIGHRVKLKVVKNKISAPFVECEFDIGFSEGVSSTGTLLDLGVEHGFIEKKGAWFARNGEMIGQGRDAAKQFFRDKPDIAAELTELLKAKLIPNRAPTPEAKAA